MLDVGCGRGEFLALLQERGVRARGIDVNESMVEVCRQKGLAASKRRRAGYLRAQPAGSLGGLLAAQVVEHLDPGYLTNLLDAAWAALRPGSPIVLETINPACWFAFFESYVRDITHVRPLHPDTLKFLLLASGFEQRGDPLPVALPRAREAAAGGAGGARRRRRDAERQRGEDQLAAVHLPGLRGDRRHVVAAGFSRRYRAA